MPVWLSMPTPQAGYFANFGLTVPDKLRLNSVASDKLSITRFMDNLMYYMI
jgi:hypothetical protein